LPWLRGSEEIRLPRRHEIINVPKSTTPLLSHVPHLVIIFRAIDQLIDAQTKLYFIYIVLPMHP